MTLELDGGLAFNVAAVSRPDVLVRYYGSALTQLVELAPKVTAPSLHHLGNTDASALAWRRTEDFLARHFPTSQG